MFATLLDTGEEVEFEHRGCRIMLKNLPERTPDTVNNIPVFKLEFDEKPEYHWGMYYPQVQGGQDWSRGGRL